MKHLKFLAAVCCMLAVFTACEKNEPSDNTNGNGINTDQNGGNSNTGNDNNQNGGNSNTDNSSGSVSAPTGTENGHGYVDLGLPSGTKWATCNVGATKPEEYGDYYAWGETEPNTTYNWATYKWCNGSCNTLTKYNTSRSYGTVDNNTRLYLSDDAAHANWGGAWRMPTNEEWKELRENCEWTWTSDYNGTGVKGRIVTSNINGNSIFLPAAGYRGCDDLVDAGSYGSYWSSSLNTNDPDDAWSVFFYSGIMDDWYDCDRCCGRSVRPVLYDSDYNATGTENGYGYVDLGLPSGLKWAVYNVGATKPEEYGNYYAWGETEPKTLYKWSTYKWCKCNGSSTTLTKYNTSSRKGTVDNKTVLELADDAARANWGGAWRMPTDAEWTELRENCTWTWTSNYNCTGVKGRIVTSNINGNSIFLPAAGYRNNDDLNSAGDGGYYWSSSLYADSPGYAWRVYFYSDGVYRDYYGARYYGQSVRPVLGE